MVHAFLLAASVIVSGVVVDRSGRSIANARVLLTPSDAPSNRIVRTTSDGRFSFEVVPGTYRLRVEAGAYRPVTVMITAAMGAPTIRIALEPSTPALIGSVTGTARTPLNVTPLSQRVFPREAYRDQAQTSLSSVLDQTPGATTARDVDVNAAVPVAPALASVRGGIPFETLALLDGTPISLPSSGTFDVSLIPTFELGDVEIVKGPGDPAGGGGSVGGAVNFRTAEPTATLRALPEIEGDSAGGQFGDLGYSGTLPGGKFAFATMASVDGAPGPTAGFAYPVEGTCCAAVPGDELRRALLVDLRAFPTPGLSITGTMLAVNLDRSLAATEGAQALDGVVSLAPALDATENDRFRFDLLRARYASGDDAFDARAYDSTLARDFGSSAGGGSAYDTEAGGTFAWSHAIANNRYSLEIADSAGTADGQGAAAVPIAAGSRLDSFRIRAAASLAPTARDRIDLAYEAESLNADAAPDGASLARSAWATSNARIGYARTLRTGLAVHGSIGTSVVPPPLEVLSGALPAMQRYVGLPARSVATTSSVAGLERANGVDLGLEWRLHGETTTVSASVYGSQTLGAYVQESSAAGPQSVRQTWFAGPPMIDDGIEFSIVQFKPVGLGYIAQFSLPRTYVRGPLDPSFYSGGNLAMLPGQNLSGGAFFAAGQNDAAPVRVPYSQGYAELSYKWPRGSRASVGALYLGSNNAYGRTAFATLNANLEISVGDRGKLQFSIENLTDALDARLPIAFAGVGVPLADGEAGRTNANVLAPRTLRFMFRQSFGGGRIFER
ncbi:MAG TPA: TonB-dependent receptor [Candidatus Tumulicola sp.]|jgi:outer membrane receptor protein involved in Fe transport